MSSLRLPPTVLRLLLLVLLATASVTAAPTAYAGPSAVSSVVSSAASLDVDTDGDGIPDTGDGCPTVASPNPTGCPSAWRKVSLKWRAGVKRLQAKVSSPVTECAARARIKLWLDRTGRSDKFLSSNASYNGRRRFKVPRGARYYVTVSPSYASGVAECGKATSRSVRVPRR